MTFDIGKTYYLADGVTVELNSITTDGKYVVREFMEYEDYRWDSRGEEYSTDVIATGSLRIVDKLFEKAPIVRVDFVYQTTKQQLEKTNQELRETATGLRSEIAELKKTQKELESKVSELSQFKGLELLSDWVNDRITHFVREQGNGMLEMDTKANFLEYIDHGGFNAQRHVKLMTLYGGSKGDLMWKISQYSDGSGEKYTVHPFTSEEAAREFVKNKCDEDLAVWRKNPNMTDYVPVIVGNLKRNGCDVPSDLTEASYAIRMRIHQEYVMRKKQELDKAQADMVAALSRGDD